MNHSEKDLINDINAIKEMMEECNTISMSLKRMCTALNAEYPKDKLPSVEAVKSSLEYKLLNYRAKLSEMRGE